MQTVDIKVVDIIDNALAIDGVKLAAGVNIESAQLAAILAEREQLITDMRMLKNGLLHVCAKLELLNEDGSFKEKLSMARLLPKITGYMTNTSAFQKDFGFFTELMPLIQRYENL